MTGMFEDFYFNKTNKFSNPIVSFDCEHQYTDEMVKECIDTLASMSGMAIEKNCRISINNLALDPFLAKKIMITASKSPNLNSINWKEIVGSDNFFIFINYAALYSSSMKQETSRLLGDFCKYFEPDGVSLEHHIIIGQYQETPFGVHIDDPTDRVFHFNIGNCEKSMLLWDRKVYLQKYQSESARPISSVDKSDAKEYIIPKGSCFFLPADYYHVACSNSGVSVVVAVAFSKVCEYLQIKAAMSEAEEILLKGTNPSKYYKHFNAKTDNNNQPDCWRHRWSLNYKELSNRASARMFSNKCMAEIDPLKKGIELVYDTIYYINQYVNVVLLEENENLLVFSNGHFCELKENNMVKKIRKILEIGAFKFDSDKIRDPKMVKVYAFLYWLIQTGSVVESV